MSLPLKASLWFMICNVLQKCIGVITTPIFTRLLTPSEYGMVSIYISWEGIITIFATLYLTIGGGCFTGMKRYKDDKDGYTSAIQTLVSCITVVLYLLYTFLRHFFGDFLGMSFPIMTLMFIDIFFTSAMSLWSIRNRYEYRFKNVILFTVLTCVLMPICSIVFVVLTEHYKVEARILGMVLVKAVIYGIVYILNLKRGKLLYSKEYWLFGIRFNLPLIPHYMSQIILEQSDRIMIGNLCGNIYSGIYSVAYSISLVMKIFTTAINASFTPWTYQCLEKEEYKELNKMTLLIEILIGCGCLLVSLVAPEVILLLSNKDYLEAVYIIPPVAISVLCIVLYGFFVNVEFFFEKNKLIAVASVLSALLNIVLNYLLIPIYGFVAAGYTTMICYFIYAIFHCVFMKKICYDKKITQLYSNIKIMWIVALFFIVLSIMCTFLYKYYIIRYIFFITILVLSVLSIYRVLKKSDRINQKFSC